VLVLHTIKQVTTVLEAGRSKCTQRRQSLLLPLSALSSGDEVGINRVTEDPISIVVSNSHHDKGCALEFWVQGVVYPLKYICDVLMGSEHVQDLLVERFAHKSRTLVNPVELLRQEAPGILVIENTIVLHGPSNRHTNMQAVELNRIVCYFASMRKVLEFHLGTQELGAIHSAQYFVRENLTRNRIASSIGSVANAFTPLCEMQVPKLFNVAWHAQRVPYEPSSDLRGIGQRVWDRETVTRWLGYDEIGSCVESLRRSERHDRRGLLLVLLILSSSPSPSLLLPLPSSDVG